MRHLLSKIFQPVSVIPKTAQVKRQDITSKSQRLMLEMGIIKQGSPGCFHFLPLGVRALDKLINIVDGEMQEIHGQKIIFPTLINRKLWEISGRIEDVASELFHLQDRHNHNYILSPTHEEVAAELLASSAPLSYKQFPLRLYQITSKFRDEMKPRFGLLRCRQFLMKDMYTFDIDSRSARETYESVCDSYLNIFNKIDVPFVKVLGSSGNMGGSLSHEFHFKSELGEEKIVICKKCGYSANSELISDDYCPQCRKQELTVFTQGIEVGHTFLLGDKYSKPLNSVYVSKDTKPSTLQMGSYGLGISRLVAAAVEVLSNEQEIRWPKPIAPYSCIILPPKHGSKEELQIGDLSDKLYETLNSQPFLRNDILIDDRTTLTIGKRYLEAKKFGYPYVIIIGQKAVGSTPQFEVNDVYTNARVYLSEVELINYLKNQHSVDVSESNKINVEQAS